MAGDEKHARELIAKATAHIEHTLSSIGKEGSAVRAAWAAGEGSDDRFALLVKLRNALEAERHHIQSLAKWVGVPDSASSLEIACEVSTALEAVLPGDDDWEYALQAEGDDEPWSDCYETRELLAENLDGLAAREDERLVRRRPAGPWEPVEEVPRG